MILGYKEQTEDEKAQKLIDEPASENDEIPSEAPIIENLLNAMEQNSFMDANQYIFELKKYIKEFPVNAKYLNEQNLNQVFYDLLNLPEMIECLDNIVSCLYAVLLIPEYHLTLFTTEAFYTHMLTNIFPNMQKPQNCINVLATILLRTNMPAHLYISEASFNILTETIAEDSSFDLQNSLCLLFTLFLRHFDLIPPRFIGPYLRYRHEFLPFIQNHLTEVMKWTSLSTLDSIVSHIIDLLPPTILRDIFSSFDISPIFEHDFCSLDLQDQILVLNIIYSAFLTENRSAINQFNLEYLASIFLNEEIKPEIEECNDLLLIFFKLIRKYFDFAYRRQDLIDHYPEILCSPDFVHDLILFSIDSIEDFKFTVKEAAFNFLSNFTLIYTAYIPELIDMGYISVIGTYLESSSTPLFYSLIRAILYLILGSSITRNNKYPPEQLFQMLEEENIYQKITDIAITEPDYIDMNDNCLQGLLWEFIIVYYHMWKTSTYHV